MAFIRKAAKIVAVNIAVLVLLLVLVEGAASTTLIAYRVLRNRGVSEGRHSRYDDTLGWVALPNVHLPDHYGPGVRLQTNSQGFRADRDFARQVPPGKTRIICSGDSFTLGWGVTNDQAWCQRLAALEPRFETVNMGQGGYGLDQAYLWYMRDGRPLDHHVLLFAFISDDFDRMQLTRFNGFGKPLLDVSGDSIVITNHPVPRTSWFTRWRAANIHTISNMVSVQFASLAKAKFARSVSASEQSDSANARARRTQHVASRIFEELSRATREKHGRLILVHLPWPGDYRGTANTTAWRAFVHDEAKRQGIPVIDFIEIFGSVPRTEISSMFAPNSHYSVKGNEFVATTLLKELPRILADSSR
jgi:hypothetical protein